MRWSINQLPTWQKTFCGRERPHFWRCYHAKVGGRSRPRRTGFAISSFVFRRVSHRPLLPTFVGNSCQNSRANPARSCWQFLPQIWRPKEGVAMPLLKPPKPTVAKHKYYIRLDEPLPVTMERYPSSSARTQPIPSSARLWSSSSRRIATSTSGWRKTPLAFLNRVCEKRMLSDLEKPLKRQILLNDRRSHDSAPKERNHSGSRLT